MNPHIIKSDTEPLVIQNYKNPFHQMVKMIITLTGISLGMMVLAIHFQVPRLFLLINLSINIVYTCLQCYQTQRQQPGILRRFIQSEIPISLIYTVWMFFLNSKQYIFYLSLAISITAKMYEIITPKLERNQTISENYILLQGKLELFTVVYTVILTLFNIFGLNIKIKALLLFVCLVGIFRLKYEVNYSFQKSVNEVHMVFDRLCKKLGMRNFYHTLTKVLIKILFIKEYYGGKRVVKY